MAKDFLLSLQWPHWLMIAGALLVVVGCMGLLIRRKRPAEFATIQDKEPRPVERPQTGAPAGRDRA